MKPLKTWSSRLYVWAKFLVCGLDLIPCIVFAGFEKGSLGVTLQKYLTRILFGVLCTFPQVTTGYDLPFLWHAAFLPTDAVRGVPFLGARSSGQLNFVRCHLILVGPPSLF
jgi:hypothetical protein